LSRTASEWCLLLGNHNLTGRTSGTAAWKPKEGVITMVSLRDFVATVEHYEKTHRRDAEDAFYRARSNLDGNFLARPFEQSMVEPIHRFLALWRSYRHPIDWKRLAEVWTPEAQNTASSLTGIRLEYARNDVLAKADKLYSHLRQAKIAGIGHTNISKLLALSLTNLCVMWDAEVRKEFLREFPPLPRVRASPRPPWSDYYRFLEHRCSVANELVDQVVQEQGVGRNEAIAWLRRLPLDLTSDGHEKPLAKLLDEYYYDRYHQ